MFIIQNEINLIFRINCQKIFYSLTIKHWHDSYFFTSIMAFYSNNRLLYSNVYSLYRREQLFDLGIIASDDVFTVEVWDILQVQHTVESV